MGSGKALVPQCGLARLSGFTVVELLVAISILAILAVLLLPAVLKGYQQAQAAKCAGNLKLLGAGMLMYAADNDGWFPQYPNPLPENNPKGTGLCWDVVIAPYVGIQCAPGASAYRTYEGPPVFHCPLGKPWRDVGVPINKSRGYGANYNLSYKTTFDDIRKLSRIPSPSRLGMIFELHREAPNGEHTELLFGGGGVNIESLQYFSGYKNYLAWRHDACMNICFADGHVSRVPPAKDGLEFPDGVIWYWKDGIPKGDGEL